MDCFEYSADGNLYKNGKIVCKNSRDRYKTVWKDGKTRKTHQVIWEMHYGEIPEGLQIDHINGDKHDNRIENLRAVTPSTNMANREAYNELGEKYIYKQTLANTYRVQIGKEYLGTYKSLEEAITVRDERCQSGE